MKLDINLETIVPRLVADGINEEERPKSNKEFNDRKLSTRISMGTQAPVNIQFTGYLGLVFMVPFVGELYKWVNYEMIKKLSMSVEDLTNLAFENIGRVSEEEGEYEWHEPGLGASSHVFSSSFILSGTFVKKHNLDNPETVVAIPQRGLLFVANNREQKSVEWIEEKRSKYWSDPNAPDTFLLCEHFLKYDNNAPMKWKMVPTAARMN